MSSDRISKHYFEKGKNPSSSPTTGTSLCIMRTFLPKFLREK